MTQKKLAFLDFNGTLSRGYISIDFMDWLWKNGSTLKAFIKDR